MGNLSTFISFLSAFIAIIAVLIARGQFKMAQKYNQLNAFMHLMEEYRSENFRKRRLLAKKLERKDFEVFSKKDKDEIRQLSHFFDNLGILVWNKMISKQIVEDFIGENIRQYWMLISPSIYKIRNYNKNEGVEPFPRYQTHFEFLATGKVPKSFRDLNQESLKPKKSKYDN